MSLNLAPGAIVRHPDQPEWESAMVQSAIGNRVTVNVEHAGKQTIDTSVVALELAPLDSRG
ncbi:MAG: DUF3553 domain-containing protein [Alphaproteobacteria bacterium]|nr:DUF3553 domain-containing protein [Alphaproteobacteria bacterium]